MRRRTFLQTLPLLPALPSLVPPARYRRYPATVSTQAVVPFPKEKIIPLGLSGFVVDGSGETVLRFAPLVKVRGDLYLRLTAALDFREHKVVDLFVAGTDRAIGQLDMRYAHPFQPFQTAIDRETIPDIAERGIALRQIEGDTPAWFLRGEGLPDDAEGLAPQLLTNGAGNPKQFRDALYSMNSFSPFGWMGGCVIDALYELHLAGNRRASQTLRTHLAHFLDDEWGVLFENPLTVPLNGRFNSIEDFLPFAAIVGLYPGHISVQKAVDFCLERRNAEGVIAGGHLTTEGCYTVAYPLAAIARQRGDATLAQVALDQLIHRGEGLVAPTAVYQRRHSDGTRSYANWGRGTAWYLLGTVKTLALLEGGGWSLSGMDEVKVRWVATAEMVAERADARGRWYAYTDRPATEVDASATAGIAAALAWGRRYGYLGEDVGPPARRSFDALCDYLTADGLLGQITQINRGGEDLQAGGYRVISQFGMGLLGQLGVAGNL